MYKIAVIFESSPYDRKGLFNSVHERIKALIATGRCSVDAYCIHSRDNAFTRHVRHTPVTPSEDICKVDEVSYRMLWYRFSILDHFTVEKFHRSPLIFSACVRRWVSSLKGYDILIAHSFTGALLAYEYNLKTGCPYIVNWHGSDIHTHPWRNPLVMEHTRKVLKNAALNFFVSRTLLDASDRILTGVRKDVIYNGVSDAFEKYGQDRLKEVRERYGVAGNDKVVAFAGTLAPVKNVLRLREIFKEVSRRYSGKLVFWIVGDGKLGGRLKEDFRNSDLDVVFWGNLPTSEMPSVMNCIDVLVLPSLNEGFPLVCTEALRCGANVVGSAAGGIPEAIGKENTVPFGEGFIDEFACKVVKYLESPVPQGMSGTHSWREAGEKELAGIEEILG